jgi:hypothetical protein
MSFVDAITSSRYINGWPVVSLRVESTGAEIVAVQFSRIDRPTIGRIEVATRPKNGQWNVPGVGNFWLITDAVQTIVGLALNAQPI